MENKSEEQISTKEFIKSVINYFKFLGSKWQLLIIATLIGTCYDIVKTYTTKKNNDFQGSITFNLDLDGGGGGGGGGMGGLAATLGLSGGKVGGSLLDATNFQAIFTSVNVFQNALMKEVKVGNMKLLFVNYYIDSSNIKKKEWSGNIIKGASDYGKYKFRKKSPELFTPLENLIISDIYVKLRESTKIILVEKSSLIKIEFTSSNEMLTKIWLETLMQATEEFYKNMKTKKSRLLLVNQERRLDSLAYLLRNNDKRLARNTFDNPLVVDPAGIYKQQTTARDNGYLSTQYYTQLANVENLNRMIFEQTPIFTVLEPVRLPLSQQNPNSLMEKLGGIICFFAMIIFLTLQDTYRKIMND